MAEHNRGHIVLDAQEARQGQKLGAMRYVLAISLALVVIAGIIVFFYH